MKKKILTVLIITIILFTIFTFINTTDTYVITSTSGGLLDNNTTNIYSVNSNLKLKFPSSKSNKIITNKINAQNKKLENTITTLKQIDTNAFIGKYNSIEENIFIIDDYIYYYRDDIYNKFYRCNVITKKIDELNFSSYALDVGKNNIGMHNFTVRNSIRTEALIHYYPQLTKQIDSINGKFYRQTFYDNKRVFFYKNKTLYEYDYEKNKTNKIANFNKETNIKYVFTK